MLKSTLILFRPTLQCCHASVLSRSSFSPSTATPHQRHHDSPFIVTPASLPFTTPSNNAFHPAHLPHRTKVRLTLDELDQVLASSKQLLHHLQQKYLETSKKAKDRRLRQRRLRLLAKNKP
ncbi:hypothetical protein [Absidia glauca]|uniref:Uncharacterized protein n=1 Tax=Absidia glauca TaxID=4829 RepID=A0A163JJX0_ABSGL|nr:hypothetical protein [Absidia glauca]